MKRAQVAAKIEVKRILTVFLVICFCKLKRTKWSKTDQGVDEEIVGMETE